jgi:DNA primase
MHGTVALGGKYLHEPARLELLKKTPVMIVRALDGDDDGRAASEVIFKQIQGDTFTCALEYAEGIKDPNEMSFESVITAAAKVEQQLQQQTLLHDTRYQQWKEEQQCVV